MATGCRARAGSPLEPEGTERFGEGGEIALVVNGGEPGRDGAIDVGRVVVDVDAGGRFDAQLLGGVVVDAGVRLGDADAGRGDDDLEEIVDIVDAERLQQTFSRPFFVEFEISATR